jgi:hypothetical protein
MIIPRNVRRRDSWDPVTVYTGVEDAALFHSTDGDHSWHELRERGSGSAWQPGAGSMCLHTIVLESVPGGHGIKFRSSGSGPTSGNSK